MWISWTIVVLALASGILMLARLKTVDGRAATAPIDGRAVSAPADGRTVTARADGRVRTGANGAGPAAAPTVSIIIPARNEARRLPPLLESIKGQDRKPFELIVVDDQSTDQTVAVACQFGATVIAPEDTGSGWTGKSRACWQGARQAAGSWLLFLDADTRLDQPDSLSRLLAAFSAAGGRGALSCQPYAQVERPYESLSAVFNIIVLAGMGTFTPWGARLRNAGLFGPCILCDRNDYFAAGGHEGVRGQVLDDLALGTAFLQAGLPLLNGSGRALISFRMYPEGLRQLWEGWSKNFSQGAAATNLPVLLLVILWVSGAFSAMTLAIRTLGAGNPLPAVAALAACGLYALEFIWLARRAGRFPPLLLLLFPVHFVFFVLVFAWSVIQTRILRRVSWRGRKIEV